MSGRNPRQSVGSLAISSRARSGSLERPCMTCTKPACEGSPGASTSTEVLLWNTGSPVNSAAVCSHHPVCSGRSLFCRAASSDSKRARAISVPSSVTPDVLPSHPTAPGATSSTHLSSLRAHLRGVGHMALDHLHKHVDLPFAHPPGGCRSVAS